MFFEVSSSSGNRSSIKNLDSEGTVKKLVVAVTIFLFALSFFSSVSFAKSSNTNSGSSNVGGNLNAIPGYPGFSFINSTGYTLIPVIRNSPQFQTLAKGVDYDRNPLFGYTWGAGIQVTERVILYSNFESYIVTEVYLNNLSIADISLGNVSQEQTSYASSNDNFGGYSVTGSTCCTNYGIFDVSANVQAPSSITQPSGSTNACCQFGQWTGTTDSSYGHLIQGGWGWGGFNQGSTWSGHNWANSNGFALFIQCFTTSGCSGTPTYFTVPSWMNGIKGQTIKLETEGISNCINGNNAWGQYWAVGASNTLQTIVSCSSGGVPLKQQVYGWYVFESPDGCSGTGCWYDSGRYFFHSPTFRVPVGVVLRCVRLQVPAAT